MERKIRVLYICSHKDLGGASKSLLDMLDSLPGLIEPIILTTDRGELSEECERRGYRCLIKKFIDLAFFKKLPIRELVRGPWRLRVIRYVFFSLSCLFFLFRNLKKHDIDIVHSNISGSTVGVLVSFFWRIPHVWHIREALDLHFSSDIFGGMKHLRWLLNKADARIAISNAIKDHLQLTERGTFVINDAVRPQNDVVYVPHKDKYFLFACYFLSIAKGAPLTVRAFGMSGLHKKGYRLKMIGHSDSTIIDSLISIAQDYGCADYIDFVPFQKDVKPYFEHATAFIQASVYEGMGRTTAEAMFFGCPVLATSYSGGTLDLVKDGKTGYLFDTVDKCAELMNNVAQYDQTSIVYNAQQFAIENLTPAVYGPKIKAVYEYVLSGIKRS